MEEKQLILKVCQNDSNAFASLLHNYEGIIYKNISLLNLNYGEYCVDKQDLYQEACVALYTACKSYKEDMGCKFSTFAYMIIRRKLLSYYSKIRTPYRNETKSLDTIDEIYFLKFLRNNPNIHYKEETENLKNDLKCINGYVNTLSKRDKKIIEQRTKNIKCEDIAASLNINTKALYNRLSKIKKNYITYKRNLYLEQDLETLAQN